MARSLQYLIEAISGKKITETREAHILTGGVAEWFGDFGNCQIRQVKSLKATYRTWKLKTNFPVRITPAQPLANTILLFAKTGAIILHRNNQKTIRIPSSTLFVQANPIPGQHISLPKKGVYHWLAIRIHQETDRLDIKQLVPGLFMEKMLEQMISGVESGKGEVNKLDTLLDLMIKETEALEEPDPEFTDHILITSLQAVEEMKQIMILHMGEKFSVMRLSKRFHMHPARLAGFFKKETGKSPAVYLRDAKLIRAKQLLNEGSKKIQDIALEIGFVNPGHFSKFFKSGTGVSPGRFRKQHAG